MRHVLLMGIFLALFAGSSGCFIEKKHEKKTYGPVVGVEKRKTSTPGDLMLDTAFRARSCTSGNISIYLTQEFKTRTWIRKKRKYKQRWYKKVNWEVTLPVFLVHGLTFGVTAFVLVLMDIVEVAEGMTGTRRGVEQGKWELDESLDTQETRPVCGRVVSFQLGGGQVQSLRTDNEGSIRLNFRPPSGYVLWDRVRLPYDISRRIRYEVRRYARRVSYRASVSNDVQSSGSIEVVRLSDLAKLVSENLGCECTIAVKDASGKPVPNARLRVSGIPTGKGPSNLRGIKPPELARMISSRVGPSKATGSTADLVTDSRGSARLVLGQSTGGERLRVDVYHLDYAHGPPKTVRLSGKKESVTFVLAPLSRGR